VSLAPVLAALLLLVPLPAAAQNALVVTGSSTVYPLMVDIVQRFKGSNPDVSIDLRSGGSGQGIADLRSGATDIAMVSRQLLDNERDLFGYTLCRDGAAVVVHRSNPLRGLTGEQLADILTGEISDWKQLGVRAGRIKLAWRRENQAIPELLLHLLKLKPEQIRSHTVIFDNAQTIDFVAHERDAITVAALGVAERSAKSGAAVKLLAYEGIAGSTRTVRDRTYLLSRPLLLVTRTVPAGAQKRLVDYATSKAVTDLHEKHGFVPFGE
jgi:phosphate transport system substrate-binding protein